jgi:hypothetical protein
VAKAYTKTQHWCTNNSNDTNNLRKNRRSIFLLLYDLIEVSRKRGLYAAKNQWQSLGLLVPILHVISQRVPKPLTSSRSDPQFQYYPRFRPQGLCLIIIVRAVEAWTTNDHDRLCSHLHSPPSPKLDKAFFLLRLESQLLIPTSLNRINFTLDQTSNT